VHFFSEVGKEILQPAKDVTVKVAQEFGGVALEDAVEEATRFAVGALQQKMAYKTRYQNCRLVVKNVKIDYTVKYGFQEKTQPK
jgi:hypothetical protein